MDDKLSFEFPAHKLVRVALRLEYLFLNAIPCAQKQEEYQHLTCLNLISQILIILEKPELRSKLYKELSKFNHTFIKLIELGDINKEIVYSYIDELSTILNYLSESSGHFSLSLHSNNFLKSIKQSLKIPGGECCYNCPELYVWLKQPSEKRQSELEHWLNLFSSVRTVIRTYLKFIRLSGEYTKALARHGYYQCQLPVKHNLHMICIKIDDSCRSIFPKVLTGQHGISLQLFELDDHHNTTTKHLIDTQIDIALCCL